MNLCQGIKKTEAGAGAQARLRARLDKGQTTNGSAAFGRPTANSFYLKWSGTGLRRTPDF